MRNFSPSQTIFKNWDVKEESRFFFIKLPAHFLLRGHLEGNLNYCCCTNFLFRSWWLFILTQKKALAINSRFFFTALGGNTSGLDFQTGFWKTNWFFRIPLVFQETNWFLQNPIGFCQKRMGFWRKRICFFPSLAKSEKFVKAELFHYRPEEFLLA